MGEGPLGEGGTRKESERLERSIKYSQHVQNQDIIGGQKTRPLNVISENPEREGGPSFGIQRGRDMGGWEKGNKKSHNLQIETGGAEKWGGSAGHSVKVELSN